jgi:hypothetical protein
MQSTLESLDRKIMVGMYQYVNTMIREYPYRFVHIFSRNHDIFTYLAHNYIDEFRLTLIRRRAIYVAALEVLALRMHRMCCAAGI